VETHWGVAAAEAGTLAALSGAVAAGAPEQRA
jgi:hypothetical protein